MRHLITLLLALISVNGAFAQDAYLNTAFMPRYWKAGEPYSVSARVRNASGTTPLITFRVDWRYNNGPVQVGNTQSTTGILPGQYWPYTHPVPFSQPAAQGTLKVWVVGVGDANHANDTLYFPVDVLGVWATKSVLMEQYTGTWCQFCPIPNSTTNALDQDPLIVVAKHHNGDELSSTSSTAYWQQFSANYSPAGVMEQEEFGALADDAAYDQWGARAEQRKLGVSAASIGLSVGFNAWQRDLTVDLAVTFTAALSGDFVVNAYIVEDNVPGNQVAGGSGYVHQQVVREVMGGAGGTAGVIPAITAAEATYNHQYTFNVPMQWDASNLRVIATVTEKRNGASWTVNVVDAGLMLVGIDEHSNVELPIRIQPNPAQQMAWIHVPAGTASASVQVIAADGRLARTWSGALQNGLILLDDLSAFRTGAYMVRVVVDGRVGHQRLVVQP